MLKRFLFAGVWITFFNVAYAQTQLQQELWGTLSDGSDVVRYSLINSKNARVSFIGLGAAIVALEVPDRDGKLADVVLGFDPPLLEVEDVHRLE